MFDRSNPATWPGSRKSADSNPDGSCPRWVRVPDGSGDIALYEDTDPQGPRIVVTEREWDDIRQKAREGRLFESCLVIDNHSNGTVDVRHRDGSEVVQFKTRDWEYCLRSLREGEFDDL